VTVGVPLPYDIVQGQDTTITAPLSRGGVAVAATAATCTVANAAGETVKTSAAALDGTTPSMTIAAADVASQSRSDRWMVTWEITHAGGVIVSRHEASLCRSHLSPVISQQDIYDKLRALDGSLGAGQSITSRTDIQTAIDSTWVAIIHRLREQGSRASLVLSPSALRAVHLNETLATALADVALTLPQGQHVWQMSQHYAAEARDAGTRVPLPYDYDAAGTADDGRRAGVSQIWLCGRG